MGRSSLEVKKILEEKGQVIALCLAKASRKVENKFHYAGGKQ